MNTVLSEIELMTATNGAVKGFYEPYPTIAKLQKGEVSNARNKTDPS